jgi:hypothetical protein
METFFDRVFMGLRPTQGDEKRRLYSNRSPWKRRPPLCHPELSRGICSSAELSWKCFSTECTRISCCAAVDRAACAAFRKESRMKLANANKPDRKSGGSAGDLQLPL